MIAIIDYGMGNLASVYNSFKKVGVKDVCITSDPHVLKDADKAVLPGVGAFEDAIRNLESFKLVNEILDFTVKGKPFLGICLGMQLMFESSRENGHYSGLGIFPGEVVKFNIDLPVPQIGWNQVVVKQKSGIFDKLQDNAYFYFDHSYYAVPKNPDHIANLTDYGIEYVSGVARDKIWAVQYHPEKSHKNGLLLIENFSKLS